MANRLFYVKQSAPHKNCRRPAGVAMAALTPACRALSGDDMSEETFSRVDRTGKKLYGPRKLLVCGYSAEDQAAVLAIVKALGIDGLPIVFATAHHLDMPVGAVLGLPENTGKNENSELRRAVIMSGLTEKELHLVMGSYRSLELPAQLWATVTPVSENWPLKDLLEELAAEREAMMRRQTLKQKKGP
jgi:hypothetical protein